jgi:integrase
MKVTEGLIDKIKVPEGRKDVIIFDQTLSGFFLRVSATGRGAYGVDFYVNGKRRRMSLGPAEKGALTAARKRAVEVLARASLGEDPLAERQVLRERRTNDFKTLTEQFLADLQMRLAPRTYTEWQRHLRKHCAPIHDRLVEAIERRDLIEQIDRIAKKSGAVTADRVKTTLSSFFGWCIERQYRDDNPASGISKRASAGARSRVLDDEELSAVWEHAGAENYGRIIKMLILTGQRRTEIGSLRWSEIDAAKRVMVLPPDRVKNRRRHVVPLNSPAMSILSETPRVAKQEFVFGESGHSGYSGWSQSKARMDSRISIARVRAGLELLEAWTLHDLRRTVASGMARLGVALPVIERILNHVSESFGGVAGVYQRHTFEDEMREALELWGRHLVSVCGASEPHLRAGPAIDPDPLRALLSGAMIDG